MSILIDSYSESNKNTQTKISIADGITKEGTSFSVSATNEFLLDNVVFYLLKGNRDGSFPNYLLTTGNAYAEIYDITGTPGTDSLPVSNGYTVLATSDPFDVSILSTTTFALKSFTFSGTNRIVLEGSHNYFVGLRYEGVGGTHRGLIIGVDNTKGNVSQNVAYYNYSTKTWVTSPNSFDICFYVYGTLFVSPITQKDNNGVSTALGTLQSDGITPVCIKVNPINNALKVVDDTTGTASTSTIAIKNNNGVSVLMGVSSADMETLIPIAIDSNGYLLINSN